MSEVFGAANAAKWVDVGPGNRRRVLVSRPELMQVEVQFETAQGTEVDPEIRGVLAHIGILRGLQTIDFVKDLDMHLVRCGHRRIIGVERHLGIQPTGSQARQQHQQFSGRCAGTAPRACQGADPTAPTPAMHS